MSSMILQPDIASVRLGRRAAFTWIFPLLGQLLAFLPLASLPAQVPASLSLPPIPHPLRWENAPEAFEAQKDGFRFAAGPKTDLFRDPSVTYNTDNAPKLLFEADSDFVLSARIRHRFASKWDGGALVLKSDSLHWVKFCFEKDYTGARRVVSVVTQSTSDDCNSVRLRRKAAYFKMAKAGKVITLYYSPGGKRWFLVRHVQLETQPGFRAGFLAQSPTGERCEVRFSRIQYRAGAIRDPYLGE